MVLLILLIAATIAGVAWLIVNCSNYEDGRPPLIMLIIVVVAWLFAGLHWSRPMPVNYTKTYPLVKFMGDNNYLFQWTVSSEFGTLVPGRYILFCYEDAGVVQHAILNFPSKTVRECRGDEQPCVLVEKVHGPKYWLYGSPAWGIRRHVLVPHGSRALRWNE